MNIRYTPLERLMLAMPNPLTANHPCMNISPYHDPFNEPPGNSRFVYLDWLYEDRKWQEQQARKAWKERAMREGSYAPWPALDAALKSIS